MLLITELYEVLSKQVVLKDDFSNNKRKWKIIHSKNEESYISDGWYYMKNKHDAEWHFYKTNALTKKGDEFIIDSEINLLSHEGYGHFGLVWGFDKNENFLNRFCVSADGERILILQFEKEHQQILHRFQHRCFTKINTKKSVRFSIIKMGAYYYFFINKVNIYMGHESLFANYGSFIGFYIEPQLAVRCKYVEVKKVKARNIEAVTGLNQLMAL